MNNNPRGNVSVLLAGLFIIVVVLLISQSRGDLGRIIGLIGSRSQTAAIEGSGSGLLAWWKFDESGGTTVTDSIGSNTGTVVGGGSFSSGLINNAISLDGSTGYIEIPYNSALNRGSGDFSVSLWMKTQGKADSGVAWSGIQSLFFKDMNTSGRGIGIDQMPTDAISSPGRIRMLVAGNIITGNTSWTDNNWHNIVVLRSSGNCTLYVDNVQDGYGACPDSVESITNNNPNITIGSSQIPALRLFNGLLDDIRFYDRALDTNDIQALFSTGGGDQLGPVVSLTAPSASTVLGAITLSATASDYSGVAGVTFKVNGTTVGSEDTSSPYSISWNTSEISNGTYPVTAVARDVAGNLATSSPVSITINNDYTPPEISLGSPSGIVAADTNPVTMEVTTNKDATCKYSPDANTSYASMPSTFNATGETLHTAYVFGLANNASYNYYVRCQVTSLNPNTSDYAIAFSIAADATAPVITSINVYDISTTSATVSWATSELSTTQIGYSLDTSYSLTTTLDTVGKTTHAQTITGLTPGTLYNFKAMSSDSSNNVATPITGTFTTATVNAPDPTAVDHIYVAQGRNVLKALITADSGGSAALSSLISGGVLEDLIDTEEVRLAAPTSRPAALSGSNFDYVWSILNQTTEDGDGTSCAQAKSMHWLNNIYFARPVNWINQYNNGTGIIGPGTTIHLCGSISTPIIIQGSGTVGHPITIKFESGAKMSAPFWPKVYMYAGSTEYAAINVINGHNYLVIDGGTNSDGTPRGIIEAFDNGTTQKYQFTPIRGINFTESSRDVEIKNLNFLNLYVRERQNLFPGGVALSTETQSSCSSRVHSAGCGGNVDGGSGMAISLGGRNIKIHNNIINGAPNGIQAAFSASPGDISNIQIYDNIIKNISWAIIVGSNGTTAWVDENGNELPPQRADNISIHDNTISDEYSWGGWFWGAGDEGLQLLCDTSYKYRAFTIDKSGVRHTSSDVRTFNMLSCSNPQDTSDSSADVYVSGNGVKVKVNGTISDTGGTVSNTEGRGFEYSSDGGATYPYSYYTTRPSGQNFSDDAYIGYVQSNWDRNHNNGIYLWARGNSYTTNTKIYNNLIGGNWTDSNTADIFILDANDDLFLFNNVLFDSGGLNGYIAPASGGKRQVIVNNTLIGDSSGGGTGTSMATEGQATIPNRTRSILTNNNLFYRVGLPIQIGPIACDDGGAPCLNNAPDIIQYYQRQGAIDNIDYNGFYNDITNMSFGFISHTIDDMRSMGPYEVHSVVADPLFAPLTGNPDNDYRLTSGSPFRGAAENLTRYCGQVPELCFDRDGKARPSEGLWDIGAYQFDSDPIADVTPPTIPTGLALGPITSSTISLSWTGSTDPGHVGPATGYKIYRGGTYIGQTTSTSYTDTGLTASTQYSYQVSAYDASGNESEKTSAVADTTAAVSNVPQVTITAGPTVSNITATGATIAWTTNISSNSQVQYGVSSNPYLSSVSDTDQVTSHSRTLTSLNPSTTYHYRVTSVGGSDSVSSSDATFSTIAAYTPPDDSGNTSNPGNTSRNNRSSNNSSNTRNTTTTARVTATTTSVVTTPTRILLSPITTLLYPSLTGSNVTNLQKFLVAEGYMTAANISGTYGSVTTLAVAAFQKKNGIVTNGTPATTGFGLVGSKTKAAINARIEAINASGTLPVSTTFIPVIPSTSSFTRPLTIGSTGSDVKALQVFLNSHGYPVAASGNGSRGKETTYFGPATKAALARFQASKKIIPAVGFFGPITIKAVNDMR